MAADRREAIKRLYDRYASGVGSYLLARVGDADLAEELLARVFLQAAEHIGQCRGAPAAWLWAIVRNEAARHYREHRPCGELTEAHVDPRPGPFEQAVGAEMRRRMHAALARLAADEHEIVYLKFFQTMRNTEIAAVLGQSPNVVGVRVHRVLAKLRSLLGRAG